MSGRWEDEEKANYTVEALRKEFRERLYGENMNKDCHFCHISDERTIAYDELTLTMRDIYPVSPGHTLVIPRRHVASFFDATNEEQAAILAAIKDAKNSLDKEFQPAGYNVGINTGAAAGQTVMHAHVHLIPRYAADTPNPRGGVRHCIPGKGDYEQETK